VVLDSLLRFHRLDPALYLFHEWCFAYGTAAGPRFGAWGRRRSLAASLQDLGIAWGTGQSADPEVAWERAKAVLDEGTPVGVTIDVYPLARAGRFPRLHHAPHVLVLAGYDEDQDTVCLFDPSPWQPGEMDIPRALFHRCWNTAWPGSGTGEPSPGHAWQWVVPRERHVLSPGLIRQLMRANALAMAPLPETAEPVSGIRGIEAMAGDVRQWAAQAEDRVRSLLSHGHNSLLEIALLREGHAGFLRAAHAWLRLPTAPALAEEFERLSEDWAVVRNLFLRGSRHDPRAVLPRAQARLRAIADRERAALAALERMVAGTAG
jgi:hypothetical protein